MDNILNEIKEERSAQNEKWGEQNHNPVEWMAILAEEMGEASKEAVDLHFKNNLDRALFPKDLQRKRLKNLRQELIQTAAVTVQMIECLDRNQMGIKIE